MLVWFWAEVQEVSRPMTDALYIIGNGFDLHHGIPSAYSSFGQFLADHDPETANLVEQYFSVDKDFWSEFEERLADFNSELLIDDAQQFLVSYGADDWSDAYHHDYQYELDRVVSRISNTMRERFAEWIRQLRIPQTPLPSSVQLNIDPKATFLNFNYTPSLQRLYGVSDSHILHIHGAAIDPESSLVLGHGWEPPNLDPYRFESEPENADMRVIEGIQIVDDYFKKTFKPTSSVLQSNDAFFQNLRNVREIRVMGHALASVDRPYFDRVIQSIEANDVRWKVSYYEDLDQTRDRFFELEIDAALVEFALLPEF